MKREVESTWGAIKEQARAKNPKMDEAEGIEKEFNELKNYRVKDQVNFNLMIQKDDDGGKDKPEDQR